MIPLKRRKITLQPNATKMFSGLNIVDSGFQSPDPDHDEGPLYKTENVLQFMVGGEGEYELNGVTYRLMPNDLFLLPKNVKLSYHANRENPYSYWWLGFDGEFVEKLIRQIGFSIHQPVRHVEDKRIGKLFQNIFNCLKRNTTVSLTRALGYFYELFAILLSFIEDNSLRIPNAKPEHVKKAIEYIDQYYSSPITVTDITVNLGLNRMYFCTLFKKETGMSPYQYLSHYRLEKARKLLMTTDLSITEIANQCGFNSINTFSDSFKANLGWSPQQYRKAKHVNTPPEEQQ